MISSIVVKMLMISSTSKVGVLCIEIPQTLVTNMSPRELEARYDWIGVFFLFAASILLLVTTISAPVWNHVGLLRVHLNNGTRVHHNSTISFGTFGWCVLNAGPQE